MTKLIHNELFKIFAKKLSWILMVILAALVILLSWAMAATNRGVFKSEDLLANGMSFAQIVIIFSVVIASVSVAEEFSKNTIKILLTRPYTRGQVLLSKFVASLIYACLLSIVLYVVVILSAVIFGSDMTGLTTTSAKWQSMSPLLSMLVGIFNNLVVVAFYLALTFVFAGGFRSLGLAITMGIGLVWFTSIGGAIINGLLIWKKLYWLRWNPFTQLYLGNRFGVPGTSIMMYGKLDVGYWPNLIMMLAYTIIFYCLADQLFKRRDISFN